MGKATQLEDKVLLQLLLNQHKNGLYGILSSLIERT